MILKRNTINPYIQAVGTILERIKWDIKIQSWISRNKMKFVKNSHTGEKAVIICNGPSLRKTNLETLNNLYTFGLNKINLMFDKTEFRPSCIVAVNKHVLEQNAEFFNMTDIPLYLDSNASNIIKMRENITFLHSNGIKPFAKDCSISINQGGTVTYVALQIAFHMGFKKIALVGCDHSFSTKGPANSLANANKIDNDHFDPNYFSNKDKWQLPDLPLSEYSYSVANDAYATEQREIVNCTHGGKLEIFKREKLEDFINQ